MNKDMKQIQFTNDITNQDVKKIQLIKNIKLINGIKATSGVGL